MIDEGSVEMLAQELLHAETEALPVPPLSERHVGLDVAQAYAIQRRGRELRAESGARVVGHKVGLTSAAMQQMLGVDEPDFGYLTEAMVHSTGARIRTAGLIAPRVEAEIALRLTSGLAGADVTLEAAVASIGEVAPALEVIDSRVADWRITLPDTVADNASSGLAVIGAFQPARDVDLPTVEMTMAVDRADGTSETEAGTGAAVLGHPAEALAWLARALAPFGEGLAAGEVVLPGAMARAVSVRGGDSVWARFAGLGDVTAYFQRADTED